MHPKLPIDEILERIAKLRVTVFGDFCLDAYWILEENVQELSVETGLPLRQVREQRYSLGGAGNVVSNLVDLGVGTVRAVGLAGDDLFGHQLLRLLRERNVDASGFLQVPGWQTMVYVKPMQGETEANRIDFGVANRTLESTQLALLASLQEAAQDSDVIVLNQQVPGSVCDAAFIARINTLLRTFPQVLLIGDSRHFASAYEAAVMKLNGEEAARFLGEHCLPPIGFEQAKGYAERISQQTGKPVFVTRGELGLMIADGSTISAVPGLRIDGPVDPVGAGDTVVSAIAAALGCGVDTESAGWLATIAAYVTVKKLRTTGTANPAEIRDVCLRLNHKSGIQFNEEG
jgi:rfaE bifunctional protein kinase chain/domain